jgi:hypothetical protein
MTDLHVLAGSAIELFRQHAPWLGDKLAAAGVAQPVREAWGLVKKRLFSAGGREAIRKVEEQPEKERNWDTLKNQLLDALEEDAGFREKFAGLAGGGALRQSITGDGNKQLGIVRSPGASVKM